MPFVGAQVLGAITLCAGISILFVGLRQRRNSSRAANSTRPESTPPVPNRANTAAQVFRLSSEASPVKSAQMTQQQKIAAALARAGRSNSDMWTPSSSVATAATDTADSVPTASPSVEVFETEATDSSLKSNLLILIGVALAIAGLYFFLPLR